MSFGFRSERSIITASASVLAIMAAMSSQAANAQDQGTQTIDPNANSPADEIIVTGVKQQIVEAAQIERDADTIINVITADDLGQFPDETLAESLERLPGITVQEEEGEGRFVVVRGLSTDFVQVTLNNAQLGSSDTNGDRSVALDVIPSDLLDEVQVGKTLLPDQDHDSFGARVDLRPLSAFNRKDDLSARITVQGNYGENARQIEPNITADFTHRRPLGDGELGFAVAANYNKRAVHGDRLQSDSGNGIEIRNPNNDPQPTDLFVPNEADMRLERGSRERFGATATLDYEDDDNVFSFSALFGQLKDDDIRIQQEVEFARASDGEIVSIAPGSARFSDVTIDRQIFFIPSEEKTFAFHFEGSNEFADDAWKISYAADYSGNRFEIGESLRGRWRETDQIIDAAWGRDFADVTVVGRGDFNNSGDPFEIGRIPTLDDFDISQLLLIQERRTDDVYSLNFDVERRFEIGSTSLAIKVGGKNRWRDRNIQRAEANVGSGTLRDAGLPDSLAGIDVADPRSNLDIGLNAPGLELFPAIGATRQLLSDARAATGLEVPSDPEDREDYIASEETGALYGMVTANFASNLTVIAGLRYERTIYEATGTSSQDVELDDGDEFKVERLTFDNQLTSFRNKYDAWLPGLHFRYDPSRDVVMRLGFSRGLVRPSFGEASARTERVYRLDLPAKGCDGGTLSITLDGDPLEICDFYRAQLFGANPLLDPARADQVDANIGWYPNPGTSITLAGFYKDIEGVVLFVDTEERDTIASLGESVIDPLTGLPLTRLETFINGGSGELYGVELNVNHFFDYLPGALGDLFFQGNISLIDSSTSSPLVRDGEKIPLPDQSSTTANATFGYEDDRLSLRISARYRTGRLERINADRAERDLLSGDIFRLDANVRFDLSDNLRLFANVQNLTEERYNRFFRSDDVSGPIYERVEDFGRTWRVGATYRF